MGLIIEAMHAYAKDQLESKETEERQKKKFIEDSTQNIRDRFGGDNLNIEIVSDKDEGIIFLVDGLKMKVRRPRGLYDIYLVQKCPKCGTEYETQIISLKNIGKALQEGHLSYDCDKILKEREPVKELTTEEKLVEILRRFVRENTSEWI